MSKLTGIPYEISPLRVHRLFEDVLEQCAGKQDNPAIYEDDQTISFRSLHKSSNQMARYLQHTILAQPRRSENQNVPHPHYVIGIMLKPSTARIIFMLAVLKIGAAYVALDPDFPVDKTKHMLQESNACLVVTTSDTGTLDGFNMMMLEDILEGSKLLSDNTLEECDELPSLDKTTSALLAICFTSGTTGKPKAVPISHKNVMNAVQNIWEICPRCESGTVTHFMSFLSIGSPVEIFSTLLKMNTLVLIPLAAKSNPTILISMIEKYRIDTIFSIPPSYFKNLMITFLKMEEGGEDVSLAKHSLKVIGSGSEIIPPTLLLDVFTLFENRVKVIHVCGMTETTMTTVVDWYESKQDVESRIHNGKIPIGKPVGNTTAYVLNDQLQMVASGETGQLAICGDMVSTGYLKDAEESFITNHLEPNVKNKIFLTGDYAKIIDGRIIFEGRKQTRCMVRGYRVSTLEIEETIRSLPGVRLAAVIGYVPDGSHEDNTTLVAYFCPVKGSGLQKQDIEKGCSEKLPKYSVPTKFFQIEELPTRPPQGKVDYPKLREMYTEYIQNLEKFNYNAGTEVKFDEVNLRKVIAQTLEIFPEEVDLNKTFFEMGGNSILAVNLWLEIGKIGYKGSLSVLFSVTSMHEILFCSGTENNKAADIESDNIVFKDLTSLSQVDMEQVKELFMDTFSNPRNELYAKSFPFRTRQVLGEMEINDLFETAILDPLSLSFVATDKISGEILSFSLAYDQTFKKNKRDEEVYMKHTDCNFSRMAHRNALVAAVNEQFTKEAGGKDKVLVIGRSLGISRKVADKDAPRMSILCVNELKRRCYSKKHVHSIQLATVIPFLKDVLVDNGAVVYKKIHLASYEVGDEKPFSYAPDDAYYYFIVYKL